MLKSSSSRIFGVIYVIIEPNSKSVASIVSSIELGISIVDFERFKLSCNPGVAIPKAIVLLPSSINLPFVIVIFLFFSLLIIVPHTTTNGVYKVSCLPLIVTVWISLLVYSKIIFTLPLLPAISLAETSLPFNSYLILHSIGNFFWVSPL